MFSINYRFIPIGILVGTLIGLPTMSFGKDTDLYLTAQGITRDDAPNVLIILDNSGSMDTLIPTSLGPYDPSIDYSAESGSPNISAGRIYWSTTGAPPNAGTNQWFSTSNNNCEASKPHLNAGGNGVYGSDKIIAFKTLAGWDKLASGKDRLVDCKSDKGATDPNGYAKKPVTPVVPYTTVASEEVNWDAFTDRNFTATLYSSNYMNYVHNSDQSNLNVWIPGGVQTRWNAATAAVNPKVHLGLMLFNSDDQSNETGANGGRIVFRVDTMTPARRTAMKAVIDGFSPSTFTPLAETMWEAYRYFAGLGVDFGSANPTLTVSSLTRSGSTVTVTTSSNHGFSNDDYVLISGASSPEYNGGFNVTRISSTSFTYTVSGTPVTPAGGTMTATLFRDTTAENGTNYISPFQFRCQQAYIIYVTDGDPTNDTAANTSARIDGLPGIGTPSGSRLDELAGWMYNNDVYPGLLGTQRVVTYTVGFGGGISASGLQLLQETATNGHGSFFSAVNANELTSALQGTLIDILSVTTAFSAPALSVNAFNTLFNRDEVYLALFKPQSLQRWNGNIKKYTLCKGNEASQTPPRPACNF
jgi:type IV pilus assembly protein PilY1